MKPYHKNPRQITRKQMDNLGQWLSELGDLSGIVHDLNTDEIIGGNQRGRVFNVNECEVELTAGPHEPDGQGTVAHGFIVWKGNRYAYRQVRWNARQAEKANIVANKSGGSWDFDLLANEFDADELIEWGFEAGELGLGVDGGSGDDAEPQIDRAEELRREWGVEAGQLWRLPSRTPGQEHRLICGDCTDAAITNALGVSPGAALLFDPPWDMETITPSGYQSKLVFGDGGTVGDVFTRFGSPTWLFVWDCVSSWYTPNRPLKRMKVCAWYGDISNYDFDGWHYGDAGEPRTVWNTRGQYKFKPDARGKHLADVFNLPITRLHAESDHNHTKPIDWITLLVANCTNGDIYDPFLGSGTTIIAAENLSRQCRAVEISPGYCAVALQRYLDTFGIRGELAD